MTNSDNKKNIYVTKPFLPELSEFLPYLESIWETGQLTNNGPMHRRLEAGVAEYLGVDNISLFNNGTIALVTAIKALGLSGEVITTPFSFSATSHALVWSNLDPVFVDIDPRTLNIDPNRIESAITSKTSAILPVHCYGTPCDVDEIEKIAKRHDLKVIYDAAHAFGVDCHCGSLLSHGDLSVLSFHATKVFSTLEGGAIVAPNATIKKEVDRLKNFGIVDEVTVERVGINGKMNELQAAFGILQLAHIDKAIEKRKKIADRYNEGISDILGLDVVDIGSHKRPNHAYFPILVRSEYGLSRDLLYEHLKRFGIFARRYFYPLISNTTPYLNLASAAVDNLPVANSVSEQVLCLPIYPELELDDVDRIIDVLAESRVPASSM